jgi:hypothetical protein
VSHRKEYYWDSPPAITHLQVWSNIWWRSTICSSSWHCVNFPRSPCLVYPSLASNVSHPARKRRYTCWLQNKKGTRKES